MATDQKSSNPTGGGVAGGEENFPGFQYLQRVINSVSRGMLAQAEELNDAWSKIRRDQGYEFKDLLKTWTRLVENSYGVMMDVVQPLGPRPNWLVIPWSMKNPPETSEGSVAVDGPAETDSDLDYTEFFGVGSQPDLSLYETPPYRKGARVYISLNKARFEALVPQGQAREFISFVFRKSQGPSPPLVIVVLRIKNDT
jgi:hypothetical protein